MMRFKLLFILSFILVAADLGIAQFGGQRSPTTPPTFPQQKSTHRADLIDINSASKEMLVTLPGIDESGAEKIVANRPYKKKADLKKKKVVSEEVYKQISDKITADNPGKK